MTSARTTITQVEPLSGRWLRLTFGDGAVHEVDPTRLIAVGRVFAAVRDDQATFEAVRVDPEFGTLAWPGDVDLDPDVLRGDYEPASGAPIHRRIVQPA